MIGPFKIKSMERTVLKLLTSGNSSLRQMCLCFSKIDTVLNGYAFYVWHYHEGILTPMYRSGSVQDQDLLGERVLEFAHKPQLDDVLEGNDGKFTFWTFYDKFREKDGTNTLILVTETTDKNESMRTYAHELASEICQISVNIAGLDEARRRTNPFGLHEGEYVFSKLLDNHSLTLVAYVDVPNRDMLIHRYGYGFCVEIFRKWLDILRDYFNGDSVVYDEGRLVVATSIPSDEAYVLLDSAHRRMKGTVMLISGVKEQEFSPRIIAICIPPGGNKSCFSNEEILCLRDEAVSSKSQPGLFSLAEMLLERESGALGQQVASIVDGQPQPEPLQSETSERSVDTENSIGPAAEMTEAGTDHAASAEPEMEPDDTVRSIVKSIAEETMKEGNGDCMETQDTEAAVADPAPTETDRDVEPRQLGKNAMKEDVNRDVSYQEEDIGNTINTSEKLFADFF